MYKNAIHLWLWNTLFHILKITINGAVGLYCVFFLLLSILHIVSVFVYVNIYVYICECVLHMCAHVCMYVMCPY